LKCNGYISPEGNNELKKDNSEISNYKSSISFWEKNENKCNSVTSDIGEKIINKDNDDDDNNQKKPLKDIILNNQDNDISNNITLNKFC
jgi:hypothetical protein